MSSNGKIKTDVEIDRREYNEHTIALLEDRHSAMMKEDGTSGQYIIAVLTHAGSEKERYTCKRYISDHFTKWGYSNAKEAARAIFLNPDNFVNVLGENWVPFCCEGIPESSVKVAEISIRSATGVFKGGVSLPPGLVENYVLYSVLGQFAL